MRFESFAFSHMGRRGNNEDALLHQPGLGVFGVADGMGGYEGGEVASQLVVETLDALYRRFRADPEATFPGRPDRKKTLEENQLLAAIFLAHQAVRQRRIGKLRDMGSTVVALSLPKERSQAVIGHVGDSRIYRLRRDTLAPLTRDHSLYEDLKAAGGALEMQSKRECPFANVITRAIGISESAEPDVATVPVQPGDLFLLCSDGLSDPLLEPEIARILAAGKAHGALGRATERLVQAAYDAGSRDNITAVTVHVLAA